MEFPLLPMNLRTALLLVFLATPAFSQEARKAMPASAKTAPAPQINPAPARPAPAPAADDAAPAQSVPEAETARPPAPGDDAEQTPLISSEVGGRDLQFFHSAVDVGRLEGWLGDLAKNKAETDQIKAIGDALQSTQAESTRFLARLARGKGVDLPNSKTAPTQQKKIADQLGALKGPKFEKALMEQIVVAAQQSVAVYEGAMKSKDEQIRRFAEQMLPISKEKLTLAGRINGSAPSVSAPNFRGNTPGGLE